MAFGILRLYRPAVKKGKHRAVSALSVRAVKICREHRNNVNSHQQSSARSTLVAFAFLTPCVVILFKTCFSIKFYSFARAFCLRILSSMLTPFFAFVSFNLPLPALKKSPSGCHGLSVSPHEVKIHRTKWAPFARPFGADRRCLRTLASSSARTPSPSRRGSACRSRLQRCSCRRWTSPEIS